MTTPLVSVTMTAFEHAAWIRQSVESVLAQRTTFPFEVVVGEDCSTDKTRSILESTAAGVPALRLVLPRRNMGFHGNALFAEVLREARGKYIAFLDGDDYWTGSDKLEQQVRLMEGDPTVAICFHRAQVLQPDGSLADQPIPPHEQPSRMGLADLAVRNVIPSCTALIRADALADIDPWWIASRFGDWALYLIAAQRGDIAFIDRTLAVYRTHGRGSWSGLSARHQLEETLRFMSDAAERVRGQTRAFARGRSQRLCELAVVCAEEGDLRAARRAFFAAVQAGVRSRSIPRGQLRRAWHAVFRRT